ncbi:MAG: PQQ-binding-like beta-propeller repeat protein [Phycisphaerales bacterium]|nr:PQQ-binding-like beta-propeller repeat protein [Phycisphaerales bacterium]
MARASWWAVAAGLVLGAAARAQGPNPVYADFSPLASDTLAHIAEFTSAGNLGEASRQCQRLLDEHGGQVVPVPGDPDLFVSVRSRVHAVLLSSPDLLARYRENEGAVARAALEDGSLRSARRVEDVRLLTPAGLEAALRVAQDHLESARFEAARLTLEQLERHPDRAGEGGARAARLLGEVARYLAEPGRHEALARAERWAGTVGPGAPRAGPAEVPPWIGLPVYTLDRPAAEVESSGSSAPLWTANIDPSWEPPPPSPQMPGAPALALDESRMWVAPAVSGETLYTNDGTTITARDRFTLQARWSTRPSADRTVDDPEGVHQNAAMRGAGRALEDMCFVTVAGRVVLATTGLARDGDRDGDPRTHALDAATGRVLWSVFVPDLDPQLETGSVRGPVLVDGDMAVVVVRKAALARRVVSVYLAGLSLRTGAVRWVRLVGSAGALPYIQQRRIGDAAVLDRGVVYVQDQLGIMGAVEAATGRPVWTRRMAVQRNAEQGTLPWRFGEPVLDATGMVVLSPDQGSVLRLDRATGAIVASRPAPQLGDPGYILRAGGDVACVGETRVTLVPLVDIGAGPIRATKAVPSKIRGRVVVAGDRLLLPRLEGFTLVDLGHPDGDGELHTLDTPGNVLPVPGQLLVLDGLSAHSYLDWPLADRLLSARMEHDPADPAPAITYAELAFRAGHPGAIAASADKALAALDRGGSAVLRTRLFGSLRDMVAASQGPEPGPRALPPDVLAAVIERLGRAAQTPAERVVHLMALGRLEETRDRAGPAIEAYQRILADAAMGATLWQGPGLRVRAGLEAARRVRGLVTAHGAASYAPFDAEAEFALRALGAAPGPAALERIAAQYPASAHSASVWLRAASLHERAGRDHAASADLREALASAELALTAGQAIDPAVPGEIAGRLLAGFRAGQEPYAALRLVRRLGSGTPPITPTSAGKPIDLAALDAELSKTLSGENRLPRIGADLEAEPQALVGWALMEPISRERASAEHVMMLNRSELRVALWGVPMSRGGPGDTTGPTRLSMLWSRPFERAEPRVLRLEAGAVYLLWDRAEQGFAIEKIDTVTGLTEWKTDPHAAYFAGESSWTQRAALTPEVIETPVDGPVAPLHVLVAVGERAVILADRTGRVVAFDPATGAPLWHVVSSLWHMHDVAILGGIVAVGGVAPPADNPGALSGWHSDIEVFDARTGAPGAGVTSLEGTLRWLRIADTGNAAGPAILAALDASLVSFDAATGRRNWEWPGSGGFESIGAWVLGGRLFVLGEDRALWMVPVDAGGDDQTRSLDTFNRLTNNGVVHAVEVPGPAGPLAAFVSGRGVLVYDPGRAERPGRSGSPAALVGIDALVPQENVLDPTGGTMQLVTPVVTRTLFVALEQYPQVLEDKRQVYTLHLLDARNGKMQGPATNLVMWAAPQAVAAIDGRIIITSGDIRAVTLVYGAPEADR